MSQPEIKELAERALLLHQQGRFAEAQRLYYEILAREPDHHAALHLLGTLSGQLGNAELAIILIRRAVAIYPSDAVYHYNLGRMVAEKGSHDQAAAHFCEAIRIDRGFAEAHRCLGDALAAGNQFEEAVASYRAALGLRPDYAIAHNNLGNALRMQGRLAEAAAHYRKASELKADFAEAFHNLAVSLREQGLPEEAIAAARRAVAIKPDYADAHNNLGISLNERGLMEEALAAFGEAIRVNPGNSDFYNNLGNALNSSGRSDDAIAAYRRALALNPRGASALVNLGSALKDCGELDAAIESYRAALAINPGLAQAHSNLVYTLHFHPGYDGRALFEEHRLWNARHAEPLREHWRAHSNDRDGNRRLRIGYVSPDFRDHVVGGFFLPLLTAHDREKFDIFCYSDVTAPDAMTRRLQAASGQWRAIAGLPDKRAAEIIEEDRIDILIDLTMHMSNNRMLLFARKPAPVQATYLAYCSTTGLSAMDYRLSDPYLDPPDHARAEGYYSEKTIRLAESYWCYAPALASPPPAAAPGREHVTFGSLNNFCKISQEVLSVWAGILLAVPDSRLLMHGSVGGASGKVLDFLASRGVDSARVEIIGRMPLSSYFEAYRRMDIALDTFPYAGGTTTCDALWMGVPVVTLAGGTAVGRGGVSILSNVGLRELIARDVEEYVRIAVGLAGNGARMRELRVGLRERMRRSPLMDGERFARNFEEALRGMWRAWCAGGR